MDYILVFPQSSYVETFIPNAMVFGDEAFRR